MWRIEPVVPPEKPLASERNQACSDIRGRCLLLYPAPNCSSVTGITHKYTFIFRSLDKKTIDTTGIQSNKIICELWRSNTESPEASKLWAQSCAHSSPPNIYQHLPKFRITVSYDCAVNQRLRIVATNKGDSALLLSDIMYTEPHPHTDPSGSLVERGGLYLMFNICFWNSAVKPTELRGSLKSSNTVETAGFASPCFGHTWFIVLSFSFGDPPLAKSIFFSSPRYTAALPVGFGINIRSVYLTSVWLTALVLCLPLDRPQVQPRMLA